MATLRVPVNRNDHILGSPRAFVTIVEYGDYQCPYCRAAEPQLNFVLARLGDRVARVFRHFPLTEIHPQAEVAAETAEFAGAYSRFWQMHELIFANQPRLSPQLLYDLASRLGLSQIALHDALTAETYAPKVQQDFMGGTRSGVAGTPTFFINGKRHDGGYSAGELMVAIEAEIETAAHPG
ncbi:MAG TPA: thioredoxin domain-containing protein [Devosiaceae bacterium]|nr:thioredoxin domain-containing protein [Devosiaceae bacterium]